MSDSAWDKVRPWVAKIAPMLGTALGGPLGGAAGALLSSALGAKDQTPESVEAALRAGSLTPEQLVALKAAEQDFALKMKELDINSAKDLEALVVDDRKDARAREIAVRDHTPAIAFYGITLGFFALLTMMLFHVIPAGNERVLDVMVGALATAWIGAVNYYYGSTRGSQAKDLLIYNSTPADKEK